MKEKKSTIKIHHYKNIDIKHKFVRSYRVKFIYIESLSNKKMFDDACICMIALACH